MMASNGSMGTTHSSNKQLTSYYESLRSNVMSILGGGMKVPNEMEAAASMASSMGMGVGMGMGAATAASTKDNFDSYLSKLQTICTDNVGSMGDETKTTSASSRGHTAAASAASTASGNHLLNQNNASVSGVGDYSQHVIL